MISRKLAFSAFSHPALFRHTAFPKQLRWYASVRLGDDSSSPSSLVNVIEESKSRSLDWEDRSGLQDVWSKEQKGWTIDVEYKETPYGIGVFSVQDVPKDTVLRFGLNGRNLLEFTSAEDILSFCRKGDTLKAEDAEFKARLSYATDYLWGFSLKTDHYGFSMVQPESESNRFYGIWLPGNGLNHRENANTVYRTRAGGTSDGINLEALVDISAGDELFDDYRRHGASPQWLADFSKVHNTTLNFADCNDFV